MPERVKLEKAGEELVLRVSKVTKENVQNSDYYLFTNGNKELLVPVSSVSRQLANLEITDVTTLVGQVIKLSRSSKLNRYGKPFWDLLLASPEEAKAAGNGASAALPAAASNGAVAAGATSAPKSYSDLYGKATDYVLNTILPKYKSAGKAVETSEVIAMVRDLFNAKTREN